MKNINLGVIGAGDHANRFILPALANIPGVALSGLCTKTLASAQRNAARHGAAKAYTDYRQMIEETHPDAVIIVGPPQLHYEAGKCALAAGIPFFCEKPPAPTAAQALELARLAEDNHTFGQVGFMMRHAAITGELKRQMTAPLEYGTIRYYTSGPYRSDAIYGLPGMDDLSFLQRYLLIQAIHPVNLAASFLGKVTALEPYVRFAGENILCEIRLTGSNGARINAVLHTLVSPGYGNLQFAGEFFCQDRSMYYTHGFQQLESYSPAPTTDGRSEVWQFAAFGNNLVKMGYETEIAAFCENVRAGRQPTDTTTLADAAQTMQILESVANIIKEENK